MSNLVIISGGQTGVDRAALDAALAAGLPIDGWLPKGRLTEDGNLAPHYGLKEIDEVDYGLRTEKNVTESDATFILSPIPLQGGTALTRNTALRLHKPLFICALDAEMSSAIDRTVDWMKIQEIERLNVAGPRASEAEGVYDKAFGLLKALFDTIAPGKA